MIVESRGVERMLLACGAAGAVLFVASFLVQGAVRPDYSPLRHPVSSLSFGPAGWVQNLTFLLTGALVLASAFGTAPAWRRLGGGRAVPVLIALVGLGLIGAGLFDADPLNGYPVATPLVALTRTGHGVAHDMFSTPVFTALPAAALVVGHRLRRLGALRWARLCTATGIVFLLCFTVTSLGFSQLLGLGPIAGLLQRVTLVVGLGWLFWCTLWLRREPAPTAAAPGTAVVRGT